MFKPNSNWYTSQCFLHFVTYFTNLLKILALRRMKVFDNELPALNGFFLLKLKQYLVPIHKKILSSSFCLKFKFSV